MPSTVFTAAAAVVALSSFASAHMAMIKPYPYHSTANPKVTWETADYSMTAPLVSNGLPYPCKGYKYTESEGPREQWSAGQTISVEIGGSAVHGGGSCQYSLSYDNGENFHVIESIIGGCLIDTKTFQVQIPDNAPAGEAIFAWTWFNKVGNREMYMNCLSADIASSSSTPLSSPTIFVANAAVNQCSTVEGVPVVFPNPGDVVTYGGEYAGKSIGNGLDSGAGAVGTNCFAPGSDGAGSVGSAPAPVATTAAATSAAATSAAAASAAAPTTSSAAVEVAPTTTAQEVVPTTSSAAAVVSSSEPAVAPSTAAEAATTSSAASSAAAVPTKQAGANSDPAVVAPTTTAAAADVTSAAATSAAPVEATTSAAVESAPAAETTSAAPAAEEPTTAATTAAAVETTAAASPAASSFVSVVVKGSSAPVAEPTQAAEPEVVKCETGEWKCVGQVLTQCAWDVWYSMADCSLQTGTVCNASTPVGCIWPFQVPGYTGAKKRHFGTNHHGHGRSRKRSSTPPVLAAAENQQ